jgi:hypothetical protein
MAELEGHWLPKSAIVKQPDGTESRLTFVWNSVNGSVAEYLELERLQQRYKIPVLK